MPMRRYTCKKPGWLGSSDVSSKTNLSPNFNEHAGNGGSNGGSVCRRTMRHILVKSIPHKVYVKLSHVKYHAINEWGVGGWDGRAPAMPSKSSVLTPKFLLLLRRFVVTDGPSSETWYERTNNQLCIGACNHGSPTPGLQNNERPLPQEMGWFVCIYLCMCVCVCVCVCVCICIVCSASRASSVDLSVAMVSAYGFARYSAGVDIWREPDFASWPEWQVVGPEFPRFLSPILPRMISGNDDSDPKQQQ